MKALKIHLVLILVSCLFGVNYVVGKYGLHFVGAGAWAMVRVLLTAICMAALAFPKIRATPPTKQQWTTIAGLAVFGIIINQVAFAEGLSRTTPTHSAIINTCAPLFVLFFSVL